MRSWLGPRTIAASKCRSTLRRSRLPCATRMTASSNRAPTNVAARLSGAGRTAGRSIAPRQRGRILVVTRQASERRFGEHGPSVVCGFVSRVIGLRLCYSAGLRLLVLATPTGRVRTEAAGPSQAQPGRRTHPASDCSVPHIDSLLRPLCRLVGSFSGARSLAVVGRWNVQARSERYRSSNRRCLGSSPRQPLIILSR